MPVARKVWPHIRIDAGRQSPPLDHRIGAGLGEEAVTQLPGPPADCPEQRAARLVAQAFGIEIGVQVFLKAMVAWHFMLLAALFV